MLYGVPTDFCNAGSVPQHRKCWKTQAEDCLEDRWLPHHIPITGKGQRAVTTWPSGLAVCNSDSLNTCVVQTHIKLHRPPCQSKILRWLVASCLAFVSILVLSSVQTHGRGVGLSVNALVVVSSWQEALMWRENMRGWTSSWQNRDLKSRNTWKMLFHHMASSIFLNKHTASEVFFLQKMQRYDSASDWLLIFLHKPWSISFLVPKSREGNSYWLIRGRLGSWLLCALW